MGVLRAQDGVQFALRMGLQLMAADRPSKEDHRTSHHSGVLPPEDKVGMEWAFDRFPH